VMNLHPMSNSTIQLPIFLQQLDAVWTSSEALDLAACPMFWG
jgi:hypothetical protein